VKKKAPNSSSLDPFEVNDSNAGLCLRDALVDHLYDLASAEIGRLLLADAVSVDGVPCRGDRTLVAGERVAVELPDGPLLRFKPCKLKGFEVLYEDAACFVAMKPAGVSVAADRGSLEVPFMGACIKHLLAGVSGDTRPPRPRLVHRLDKETSGAVVLAKSREGLRHLTAQFEKRQVTKQYLALVQGAPHRSSGTIDLPIGRDLKGRLRAEGRDSRPASTGYVVEEAFRGYALVRATPVTGRQHQIRVHLEAVGHPLVVDKLYGGGQELLLSSFKKNYVPNRRNEERPLLSRLALHAARVIFRSPVNDEQIEVEAPLPKDLRVALKQLQRWARG